MSTPSALSDQIVMDTSAYYALSNRHDEHHVEALAIQQRLIRERYLVRTTNLILGETYTLMLNRLGRERAYAALQVIRRSALAPVRVEPFDEERAWEIIEQYDDKAFSFFDATSFAVMDRLGIHTAFAFDQNFRQYGHFTVLSG